MGYIRGKIEFNWVPQEEILSGRDIEMYEIDCDPEPVGAERKFNYSLMVYPTFDPQTLRESELGNLLIGAKEATEASLDSEKLLLDLGAHFDCHPREMKESDMPFQWKSVVDCYKVSIHHRVGWLAYWVSAMAIEDFYGTDEDIPAQELVAYFRVLCPYNHEFRRKFTWNPKCIPQKTPLEREEEVLFFGPRSRS